MFDADWCRSAACFEPAPSETISDENSKVFCSFRCYITSWLDSALVLGMIGVYNVHRPFLIGAGQVAVLGGKYKWNPSDRNNWIFAHRYRHMPSCHRGGANVTCLTSRVDTRGMLLSPRSTSVHVSTFSSFSPSPMHLYKPWLHTLTWWGLSFKDRQGRGKRKDLSTPLVQRN